MRDQIELNKRFKSSLAALSRSLKAEYGTMAAALQAKPFVSASKQCRVQQRKAVTVCVQQRGAFECLMRYASIWDVKFCCLPLFAHNYLYLAHSDPPSAASLTVKTLPLQYVWNCRCAASDQPQAFGDWSCSCSFPAWRTCRGRCDSHAARD